MRAPVYRRLAPWLSITLLPFLAACVSGQPLTIASGLDALQYETLGSYMAAPNRAAALHRNRSNGQLSVDVLGTTGRAPLPNFTDARIVHVAHNGNDQVAVIQGSSPSCPADYQIVATDNSTVSWTNTFGTCNTAFQTYDTQHGLLLVQQGVSDPLMVSYNGRTLTAPMLKSTLDAQAAAQHANQMAAHAQGRPGPAQYELMPRQHQQIVASHVEPAIPVQTTSGSAAAAETPAGSSRALQHVSADQLPQAVSIGGSARATGPLPSFNPE